MSGKKQYPIDQHRSDLPHRRKNGPSGETGPEKVGTTKVLYKPGMLTASRNTGVGRVNVHRMGLLKYGVEGRWVQGIRRRNVSIQVLAGLVGEASG